MTRNDHEQQPAGPSLGPNESASQELNAGGEWPDPDAPPADAAPGSDPARAEAIRAERERGVSGQSMTGTTSSMSSDARTQAGEPSGQTGAARTKHMSEGNTSDYDQPEGFARDMDESIARGDSARYASGSGGTTDVEGRPD